MSSLVCDQHLFYLQYNKDSYSITKKLLKIKNINIPKE